MKHFKLFLRMTAIVLTFAIFAGINAFSQMSPPNTPVKFNVQVNNNQNAQAAYLYWVAENQGTPPTFFIIYRADKKTDVLTEFKRFEYVRANDNTMDYKFAINLPAGIYSFYLTAIAFSGNTILESQPTAIATVEIKGVDQEPFIRIVSQPLTQAYVGKEYQYFLKYESNINCPIDQFSFIGDVPPGMRLGPIGEIYWTPEKAGDYPIAISAGTSCKINVQPAVQKFVIKVLENGQNQGYLKIVSQPDPYGKVGQTYIYQVRTESNVKCPVLFDWQIQPLDGVKFDAQNGTLTIVAQKAGYYSGYIRAYLECDKTIQYTQQFSIKFGDELPNQPCATVYGTVTYEDGTIPVEAKVKFWLTDRNNKDMNMIVLPVKQGSFYLQVPEGTYIADVDGPFAHEYYKDASTIDQATKIVVKCNEKTEVNFVVAKLPEPVQYTVSGTVTSQNDGSPIMTIVEFIPVELMKGLKTDNNSNTGTRFMTKTDQNGNYSIKLPNTFTYIGHAVQPVNSQYLEQFFDGVDSPYEADILEMAQDLTGINFALKTRLPNLNSFSGIVKDSALNPVKSRVMAYLVTPRDPNFKNKFMQQTETSNDGTFKFSNLIPGDYVLLSIPTDRSLLPGYYKQGDFVALKWKEATKISVDDNMIQIVFEIKHKLRTGLKGLIKVEGVVTALSNSIKKGDMPLKGLVGLPGVFVYILDENGAVSDFAFTDQAGLFLLTEVAQGSNKLFVDKPGYTYYNQSITNDYEKNLSSNVNIGLEPEGALGIPEDVYSSQGFKIYPTPSTGTTTIEFTSTTGTGTMSVMNSIGMEVQTLNIETTDGLNIFNLNLYI